MGEFAWAFMEPELGRPVSSHASLGFEQSIEVRGADILLNGRTLMDARLQDADTEQSL